MGTDAKALAVLVMTVAPICIITGAISMIWLTRGDKWPDKLNFTASLVLMAGCYSSYLAQAFMDMLGCTGVSERLGRLLDTGPLLLPVLGLAFWALGTCRRCHEEEERFTREIEERRGGSNGVWNDTEPRRGTTHNGTA